MGHHAQYRKRGSTPAAPAYPLTPPASAEFDVEWNGSNIRARFNVPAPAPANGLMTSYMLGGSGWVPGLSGTVEDTYFAIEAGAAPGLYFVRTAWALVGAPTFQKSDWSNAKLVTVT